MNQAKSREVASSIQLSHAAAHLEASATHSPSVVSERSVETIQTKSPAIASWLELMKKKNSSSPNSKNTRQ